MAGTDIEFPLTPAAIGAINSSIGGLWAIGGAVTSLDGSSPDEIIFAFSDFGAPHMAGVGPRLELTLAPEPGAAVLLGMSALSFLRRRR